MKQNQRQHGCQFKTGGVRLFSLLLLMLLTLMLLPARMVAQTDYDKSVTFTAITGSETYFGSESYENLFDGKKSESDFSKWCCSFSNPRYVIFEASKPGKPVGYTITTGNDNESATGRNPKSWNLYGNNEGQNGNWTLIQSVTNDNTLQDRNYTSYDFTCEGTGSYKYFKWEITEIWGSDVMQVAEFELKLITCAHQNADGSSALEVISTTPATCIKHGYTTYECSICNNKVVVEIEGGFVPHTLVKHEAKAPTCTENGNIEYWECEVCSKLFGDENATDELADLSATVVKAEHKFNSDGTCSVCGYTDNRYGQIAMDGIIIKSINDNDYPWEKLDVSELSGIDIPENSHGLMSNKISKGMNETPSECVVSLRSDKPFLLSFNYGYSISENGIYLDIFIDNIHIINQGCDESKTGEVIKMLSAGEHSIKLVGYKNDGNESTRVLIYNLKADFTYTGAVAEYKPATKTLTLKYLHNEEVGDNMWPVDENNLGEAIKDKRSETEHVVIDESFKSFKPTSLYYAFNKFSALTKIEGLGNINTSSVESMSNLFSECTNLKDIDIDKLNTSNVTSMVYMFWNCTSLETLDLSGFNTENVTTMASMFSNCTSLKTIEMSNFNTAKVKNMEKMFTSCTSLEVLDLSGFNTASIECMNGMFAYCGNLKKLIVPDAHIEQSYNYNNILLGSPATIYCTPKEASKSKSLYTSNSNTRVPYVSINPNAEYGTLCVPVGSTLAEGGFSGFDKLYTVKEYDGARGKLKLQEATSIDPGVAYVYHRNLTDDDPIANAITFTTDKDASTAVDAPVNDGSFLKGTFERITALGGSYILQTDGMFHPVAQGNTTIAVGAYRAYLDLGSSQEAKVFSLSFEDNETTDIKGISEDVDMPVTKTYYDLMGRRVSSPSKGHIYIMNGQKVVY